MMRYVFEMQLNVTESKSVNHPFISHTKENCTIYTQHSLCHNAVSVTSTLTLGPSGDPGGRLISA